MGVTRLKRKGRRNKHVSAQRVNQIKQLTAKPVLKNVDKEELKASFQAEEPKKATKAKKEEAPKAEAPKEETPKAEVKKEKATKKAEAAAEDLKAEEAPAKEESSEEESAEK